VIAKYVEHKSENISIAVMGDLALGNQNFYLHGCEILFLWVGELADGFGCR